MGGLKSMSGPLSEREEDGSLLEVGVWAASLSKQEESGDRHFVKVLPNGVFVAVVDGLGHGAEAAVAARAAVGYLDSHSDAPLLSLFQRCHSHLKNTRGVVMSLAWFNAVQKTMTWLGVGNVAGLLLRADATMNPPRETILLRGGVVGLQLPQLYASVMPVFDGDTLIFATDGIASTFADGAIALDSPQKTANRIGMQFKKGTDDALVLVARYAGYIHAIHNS
jgi:negative regulator of sigma-B (phosphoserine phosphatase)